MAIRSFEKSGINDPAKWPNKPDDLPRLSHSVGTANCDSGVVKDRHDLLLTVLYASFVVSCWSMMEFL